MVRRRRPLMRAAMIGGAGYAVGKSAANSRQAQQQAAEAQQEAAQAQQQAAQAQQQAAAPAAPAAGGTDVVAKLTELKGLMDAGALTPEEFEAAKQKLLSSS